MVGAGIGADKQRLLRGQATSIAAVAHFDDAIQRVMETAGCDVETAREALALYVPGIRELGPSENTES